MKLLENKPNSIAASATYPYGNMKDDTGAGDGSNADTEFMTDYVQFFEKLFDESGLSANGLPDNFDNDFQLYDALRVLFPLRQKTIDIGAWNMDATPAIAVNHGLGDKNLIRTVSCIIIDDANLVRSLLTVEGTVGLMDNTVINLNRNSSGFYDSTAYDDAVINRGYLTIGYIEA